MLKNFLEKFGLEKIEPHKGYLHVALGFVVMTVIASFTISSASIQAQEETEVVITQDITVPDENIEKLIKFLRKLNSNKGQSDLQRFLDNREAYKERLNLIKENIKEQLRQRERLDEIQAISTSFGGESVIAEAQIKENPTYGDFIAQLEEEIRLAEVSADSLDIYKQIEDSLAVNMITFSLEEIKEKILAQKALRNVIELALPEQGDEELSPLVLSYLELIQKLDEELVLDEAMLKQKAASINIQNKINVINGENGSFEINTAKLLQKNGNQTALYLNILKEFDSPAEKQQPLTEDEIDLYRLIEATNNSALIDAVVQQTNENRDIASALENTSYADINNYYTLSAGFVRSAIDQFSITPFDSTEQNEKLFELLDFFNQNTVQTSVVIENTTYFNRYVGDVTVEEPVVVEEEPTKPVEPVDGENISLEEESVLEEVVEEVVEETPVEEIAEEPAAEEVVEEVIEEPAQEEVVEEEPTIEEVTEEPVVEEVVEAPLTVVVEEITEESPAEEVVEEAAVEEAIEEPTTEEVVEEEAPGITDVIKEVITDATEAVEEAVVGILEEVIPGEKETEEATEEVVEEVIEEPVVEEVLEAPLTVVVEEITEESPAEEVVEEVVEETPVEEIAEEPAAEEVVEEVIEEPAQEEVVEEEPTIEEVTEEPVVEEVVEEEVIEETPIDISTLIPEEEFADRKDIQDLNTKINFVEAEDLYIGFIGELFTLKRVNAKSMEDIREKLIMLGADEGKQDELISFLNRIFIEIGYNADDDFDGFVGVLRFDVENCPVLAEYEALDEEELEDLDRELNTGQRNRLLRQNRGAEIKKRKLFRNLKQLKRPFCIVESEDISTRNIIDEREAKQKIEKAHKFVKQNIAIDFRNNGEREIGFNFQQNRIIETQDPNLDTSEGPAITYGEADTEIRLEDFDEDDEIQTHSPFKAPEKVLRDIVMKHDRPTDDLNEEEVKYSMAVIDSVDNSEVLYTPVNPSDETEETVIYTSDDNRVSDVYKYVNDPATIVPNQIKSYTIYNYGEGTEEEIYGFENAALYLRSDGKIEGFYVDGATVDGSTIRSEAKTIYENGGERPDFVIDAPFAMNRDNELIETMTYEIVGDNFNQLKVTINANSSSYPIVLDPTITFTAPGVTTASATIEGNGSVSGADLGQYMTIGDINNDGKDDLLVSEGLEDEVYIFYNNNFPADVTSADITLSMSFDDEPYLRVHDLNQDGKNDLIIGEPGLNGQDGQILIFNGVSSWPSTITSGDADIIITGETDVQFGYRYAIADLDSSGTPDLLVGGPQYSTTGRAYIIYNDGSWGTTSCTTGCLASNADVIIDGAGGSFGDEVVVGDLDADGDDDVVVGAFGTTNGHVYIFYNDGSYPTAAGSADHTITGPGAVSSFGIEMTTGDLDNDGDDDLVVTNGSYSSGTGRVHIFYNDGSLPTTSATSDVTITGDASTDQFGTRLETADMNGDGREDLVVSSSGYNSIEGRVTIFYQPSGGYSSSFNASDADAITIGAGNLAFGQDIAIGDLNADGAMDFAASEPHAASQEGHVHIFFGQGGTIGGKNTIDGESGSLFGQSMAKGDFNADGIDDVIIGAPNYNTDQGRAYIFYSPNKNFTATNADVVLTGAATGDNFGYNVETGDIDQDGLDDVLIAADQTAAGAGQVHVFYQTSSGYGATESASSDDVTFTGTTAGDCFGRSITVGDMSNDGITDVLIGAPCYSSDNGRGYLFEQTGGGYSATVAASSADSEITYTSDYAEQAVSTAIGDFDLDGKQDIVSVNGASGVSGSAIRGWHQSSGFPATLSAVNDNIEINLSAEGAQILVFDFDLDGDDDFIIGDSTYNTNQGRIEVFLDDVDNTPDYTFTGETGSFIGDIDQLAFEDLNDDGMPDLITSGNDYNSNTGRAYVMYQPISGFSASNTLGTDADIIITGDATSGDFGNSLVVGDFNQDGINDLMIGATGYSSSAGRVYTYFSEAQYAWNSNYKHAPQVDLYGGIKFKFDESTSSNQFGYDVVSGDFNGDGKNDVAVGANEESKVYIFLNDGDVPNLDSEADVIISGDSGSEFGETLEISRVSTVDDHIDDLLIGAPSYNSSEGRVYMFAGRTTWSATYDAETDADLKFTGVAGSSYGQAISAKHDIDDTYDNTLDILVGAPGANSGDGAVYMHFNDDVWNTFATGADDNLVGTSSSGESFGEFITTGYVSTNGDRRADIVVAAPDNATSTGKVYVFNNDGAAYPAGAATADVSFSGSSQSDRFGDDLAIGKVSEAQDDTEDIVIGAEGIDTLYIFNNDGTYGSADTTISGTGNLGREIKIGDINRDGIDDIIASEYSLNSNTGAIRVLFNDGSYPSAANADISIDGVASGGRYGLYMDIADVDNDGFDDIINSSYSFDGGTDGGAEIITFGTTQIEGETATRFITASSVASGDFDNDGGEDLAIGDYNYSSNTGRVWVFYDVEHKLSIDAANADLIISGESSSGFGGTLQGGDFDGDGDDDLMVGGFIQSSNTGKVYVFYNDGSYPTTAATADLSITGEATSNRFGHRMTKGDFDADGDLDFAVAATLRNSSQGRVYVFYNDGSYPTAAASADEIITGENTGDNFGIRMIAADTDSDNRVDLIVGANGYSSDTGRVYIFENDGSYASAAGSADVIITGEATSDFFGNALAAGDIDKNGFDDLIVGAYGNNTAGKIYVFYTDGSIPTTAATADYDITGESLGEFGKTVASADINNDGNDDILVGADNYSTDTGRSYVFFNKVVQGTIAQDADIILTGESTNENFGLFVGGMDLNNDAKTDIITGSYNAGSTGKLYIIYGENMELPEPSTVTITDLEGDTTAAYWDITDDSATDLVIAVGESTECRWSTSDIDDDNYSSATTCSAPSSNASTCSFGNLTDTASATRYFRCTNSGSSVNSVTNTSITFGVDVTTPTTPVISSTSHASEVTYYNDATVDFTWTDPDTGPSDQTYYYCIDQADTCDPDTVDADRTVTDASVSLGTNYVRVKNCDLFACSAVDSFTVLVDTTVPGDPVISCSGKVSGTPDPATSTTCTWDDTTGPSTGTFNYCTDTLNTCTPSVSDPDRSVDLSSLPSGHTYFRVQNSDTAGSTNIVSFDIFVNNLPELTAMAEDDGVALQTIEPGDTVTFRGTIADLDGEDVSMVICTDGSTYNNSGDPCNGGSVICSSLAQTPGELTCQAAASLTQIPTAHGTYDYEVFIYDVNDAGATYTAPSADSYTVEDVSPIVSNVAITTPFTLTAGSTTTYTWTADVVDNNGDTDLASANGVVYDANRVDATCSADENNCYIDAACDPSGITGADENASISCSVDMYFNTNAGTNWIASATAADGSTSNTAVSSAGEVQALLSLDLRNASDAAASDFSFGTIGLGADSGTLANPIYIANTGNTEFDTNFSSSQICNNWGTAYTTCSGSTIAVTQQEWTNAQSVSYGSGIDVQLAASEACIDNNIPIRPVNTNSDGNRPLRFGIEIPTGTAPGTYSWQNLFTATSTACTTPLSDAIFNWNMDSSLPDNPPLAENDNIVAYYDFDEGSGSTATDTYGVNDGTITGATYAGSGAFGYSGDDALSFDGSNDNVIVNPLNTSITGDFTVYAWVKAGTQGYQARMIELAQAGTYGAQISLTPTGAINLDNSGGPTSGINSSTGFDDNNWHMVAVTRSGTNYELFVDGVSAGTSGGTAPAYTRLFIGERSDAGNDFTGELDNVIIFNDERTSEEISNDYIKGIASITAATAAGSGAYGYTNDNGYTFNGSTSYVDLGKAVLSTTDSAAEYSGFAWIKTTSSTADGIITQYNSNVSGRFGFRLNSGSIAYWKNSTYIAQSTATVNDDSWHHVGFTRDSSGNVKLYIDGTEDGTGTDATTFEDANVEIGTFNSGLLHFTGDIDDVQIFDKALSLSEIQYLYNVGP